MSLNYRVVFRKDEEKNEKYAKDNNGDEYYPETKQFAKDQNGKETYASTAEKYALFNVDELQDEIYCKNTLNDEYVDQSLKFRYARKWTSGPEFEEYYPIHKMKNPEGRLEYVEFVINGRYAKDNNGKSFYPLGFSGNEYWFLGINQPNDYPVSHDGFYLLPIEKETGGILTLINAKYAFNKSHIDGNNGKVTVYKGVEHYRTWVKANKNPRKARSFEISDEELYGSAYDDDKEVNKVDENEEVDEGLEDDDMIDNEDTDDESEDDYMIENQDTDDESEDDDVSENESKNNDGTKVINTRHSVNVLIRQLFNLSYVWIVLIITFISVLIWSWQKGK